MCQEQGEDYRAIRVDRPLQSIDLHKPQQLVSISPPAKVIYSQIPEYVRMPSAQSYGYIQVQGPPNY